MRDGFEVLAASAVTAGLVVAALADATVPGGVLVAAGTYALLLPRLFRTDGRSGLD